MDENEHIKPKFFGFELNQSSAAIFFFIALIALIGFISTLYSYIVNFIPNFLTYPIGTLFTFLLPFFLTFIPLIIYIYTFIISLKMRKNRSNEKIEEMKWFRFPISRTSAPILFIESIIFLIGVPFGIYGLFFRLINLTSYNLNSIEDVIDLTLYISEIIIIIIICFYTISKCLKFRKVIKTSVEFHSDPKNNIIFLGFKLNKSSAGILFILYLTSIIGLLIPIYWTVFNFIISDLPFDYLLMNLSNSIFIVVSLVIYIYTLNSCLKWRKHHINNDSDRINIFGIEMNKTSAGVLFLRSLLGLVGFLYILLGLMNYLIISIEILDDPYISLYIILFYILNFGGGSIILLIYIYTIRKCLIFKNSLR